MGWLWVIFLERAYRRTKMRAGEGKSIFLGNLWAI
jgi:hypothetical protein